MGAVEEARRLLERSGGYHAVLAKIVAAEERRKFERKRDRETDQQRQDARVRYG
jgi:hypothetical protein